MDLSPGHTGSPGAWSQEEECAGRARHLKEGRRPLSPLCLVGQSPSQSVKSETSELSCQVPGQLGGPNYWLPACEVPLLIPEGEAISGLSFSLQSREEVSNRTCFQKQSIRGLLGCVCGGLGTGG